MLRGLWNFRAVSLNSPYSVGRKQSTRLLIVRRKGTMKIISIPQISKDGHAITSVETWFQYAPPKDGEKQWVDGRSAKELAKAWFPAPGQACVPDELSSILVSRAEFATVEITGGSPEVRIPLDNYPGETRNADLVLLAKRGGETSLITVEAKADEAFDMTIGEKLQSATTGSNIPRRVEHLSLAMFGTTPEETPALKDLRYQLLNATAATLIAARLHQATQALFLIHEFATNMTTAEKRQANHDDLVAFLRALSKGSIGSLDAGVIIGPLQLPGGKYVPSGMPLFLAKIKRGQG